MIAFRMRFLAGRYHATPWGRHVNEGVPEWPPSPWRLLRALVSSWQTTCRSIPQEEATALFSALAADLPLYHLPPATAGHTRAYMPWYKKGYDDRVMIFDTFVALPKAADIYISWPDLKLSEELAGRLKELINNIGYLGRAESWCEIALVEKSPPPNCFAMQSAAIGALNDYEEVRVLCPTTLNPEPLLNCLLVETTEMRTKQKLLDPPGSHWVTYARSRDALEIIRTRHSLAESGDKGEPVVAAVFALDRFVLPFLQDTVTVGEQARSALMGRYGRLYDGRASKQFSGRDENGPLQGHRHAYYLPQDTDGDGRLDHLTVYAPDGFDSFERKALGSLREIPWGDRADLRSVDESRRLKVLLLGFYNKNELLERMPGVRPATVWQSSTPYALTRFPKTYRDGRPKYNQHGEQADGPEDQVRREWSKLKELNPSLPEIRMIIQQPALKMESGRTIRWLSFQTRKMRGRGTTAGLSYGLLVEFDQPFTGPFALGYGCHYGLGQFVPV